jgi:hypothetical protein
MDMERVKMTKPLIQIEDEVREMTDEEYDEMVKIRAGYVPLPIGEAE